MRKIVDNQEHLDTKETIATLGVSRNFFFSNAKQYLRPYRFTAKSKPWYRLADVIALRDGKPVRKASISISGITRDWTEFARSLGLHAETELCSIEITAVAPETCETFDILKDQQFVKRSRLTRVNGVPICAWSTYYPVELVRDILPDIKQGMGDIVEYIKSRHGLIIGRAKDKYTARITTFEEGALFQLLNSEPVLVLQRVSYTRDRKVLILYSDMVLMGSWFAPEHEYDVDIW